MKKLLILILFMFISANCSDSDQLGKLSPRIIGAAIHKLTPPPESFQPSSDLNGDLSQSTNQTLDSSDGNPALDPEKRIKEDIIRALKGLNERTSECEKMLKKLSDDWLQQKQDNSSNNNA